MDRGYDLESANMQEINTSHTLDIEGVEELKLFNTQERLRLAKLARRKVFKDKQEREQYLYRQEEEKRRHEEEKRRQEFEAKQNTEVEIFTDEENKLQVDLLQAFALRIESNGIEGTRKCIVPAYTFTRFGELPLELQLQIWSLAARFAGPCLRPIVYGPCGATIQINRSEDLNRIPNILHACQASRMIARRVYTIWPYWDPGRHLHAMPPKGFLYFNTLYDIFHMDADGTPHCDQNQLLQAMVLPEARADIRNLSTIRHLRVDLGIFAAVPAKLWAQVLCLEKLTIVMYMYGCYNPDNEFSNHMPNHFRGKFKSEFQEAQKQSIYGRRMEWVLRCVRERFEAAKVDDPRLHLPPVDVVVRVSEHVTDDEFITNTNEHKEGRTPAIKASLCSYNDSRWYKSATTHWVEEFQEDQISRLAEMYRNFKGLI